MRHGSSCGCPDCEEFHSDRIVDAPVVGTLCPPYPGHACQGCAEGKELIVGGYSSVVGQGAVHLLEGWVCMKYLSPKAFAMFQKGKP